jgi:hypothetical protein
MRPLSAALTAVALIPLSLGVAACKPRKVTDSSRHVYCEVMPDAPRRDDDNKPTKIIGTVRFRCDDPGAATMALAIQVQRRNAAGDWINVGSTLFTVAGAQTVSTSEETFRTHQVTTGCADGVFRVFIKGSSSASGVTKTYERAGPRALNPCRPALFAPKP